MVDFSAAKNAVAVLLEVGRQGDRVLDQRRVVEVLFDEVDPVAMGVGAGEQAGAGGLADRGLAVGIEEIDPSSGQSVDVRGLSLWVSVHRPDPVVEIIDGDEEDVGLFGGLGRRSRRLREKQGEQSDEQTSEGRCRRHGIETGVTKLARRAVLRIRTARRAGSKVHRDGARRR